MSAYTDHTHTAECLAANELNELTCLHLDGEHLINARRHVVRFLDGSDCHVFTDDRDDAIDLALVESPGCPIVSVTRLTKADENKNLRAAGFPILT